MAINLNSLYSSVKHTNIRLLAGEKGIANNVSWINMVENCEVTAAMKQNEIAFVTGVGLNKTEGLLDLVKCIYDRKGSGVIVNVGAYIKKIADEVVEFCNKFNLPLFELSCNVELAEIMKIFCQKITEAEKNESELCSAVKHAIYFPKQPDLYMPFLKANNLAGTGEYCIALVDITDINGKNIIRGQQNELLDKIKAILQAEKLKGTGCYLDNRLAILFFAEPMDAIQLAMQAIQAEAAGSAAAGASVYTAIGSVSGQADMIYKSYRHAYDVLKLEKKHKCTVNAYEKLGLYKLLLAIDDKAVIKSFDNETLKPLVEYDELNNTDYIAVLQCYLRTGGSLKETAAELFVHRNTVNYKIHKIEEILNCDLSDADERLKYTVAFRIRDIL